jgi:hypothetical protein
MRAIAYGDDGSMRNLAVPIDRHESERRIDGTIHDFEVETVPFADRAPIRDAGAAERVDPDTHLAGANRVEVDHRREITDVGIEVIVLVRGRRDSRSIEWNCCHAA